MLVGKFGRRRSCYDDKHLASFTSRKLHKQLRVGRFSDLFPFRRLPIHVQTVAVETKVLKLTAAGTVPDSHRVPY